MLFPLRQSPLLQEETVSFFIVRSLIVFSKKYSLLRN